MMKDKGELPGQVRERLAREAEEEIAEARRREEQQRIDHERMRVEREKRKADAAAQAILDRCSSDSSHIIFTCRISMHPTPATTPPD